ncbi:unnamed protein product [Thelazia callipaeda]|uniref:Protein DGCR14 n=1 Tax=Thelazia callipaeda TaxID=103827 RepID=A0A0N5CXA3_THECL|nr:unnamed protein product [Thelazia callipaeda]
MVILGAKKLRTKKEIRVVLPEDKYISQLQEIIIRDYFPELPKLKAQEEYLDAVAANDVAKIRCLQMRYSRKQTTDQTLSTNGIDTPATFSETPWNSVSSELETVVDDGEILKKKKKLDEKLTIDAYLNKYTSEDNASFEELDLLHRKKEEIRNSWMYEAEKKHNEKFVERGKELIKAADEQLMITAAPGILDNWSYRARNVVHFHPEEAPLTLEEHFQRQKADQKVINKSATRFTETMNGNKNMKKRYPLNILLMNPGKVDITGREIGTSNAAAMGLVATPSPAPGVNESPFMTWGEIEGTPFLLDASDIATTSSAPAFKIPEMPIREKIAQSITETIAKRYHDKRKIAMRQVEKHHVKTPNFGSVRSSEKLTMMSPAARRLAAQGLGIRLSSEKSLNFALTPSPSSTPGSAQVIVEKTSKTRTEGASCCVEISSSITDNLLSFGQSNNNVKKIRPAAADFF